MAEAVTLECIYETLKLINTRLDRLEPKRRFISRQEIIEAHSETWYNNAVNCGGITPIKQGGRNSKVTVERQEYESYLNKLKY